MGSDAVPRALARDYASADLSPQDRAMLDYAVKLTARPHSVSVADVQGLRDVGFDVTGILDICQVVSYYNYVNRLADGLGVELEESWEDSDMTITHAEFKQRVGTSLGGESSGG
jgi:uncharacterized peroxidase-related enzyme